MIQSICKQMNDAGADSTIPTDRSASRFSCVVGCPRWGRGYGSLSSLNAMNVTSAPFVFLDVSGVLSPIGAIGIISCGTREEPRISRMIRVRFVEFV